MLGRQRLPAGWFFKMAVLRLVTRWRSVLTLVAGVLLTVVIGASFPLYTDAIAQVGLVQRLQQRPPDEVHLFSRITLAASGSDAETFGDARRAVDDAAQTTFESALGDFGGWLDTVVAWAETTSLLVMRDGLDIDRVRVRLAHYDDMPAQVEILAGAWPNAAAEPPFRIAVPERMALALDLDVGDALTLDQRGRDSSVPFPVEIAAIFRPLDASADYWMQISPLRFTSNAQWRVESNVFASRATLNRVAADFLPETSVQAGWRVFFDHGRLNFRRIAEAEVALAALESALEPALTAATPQDTGRLLYQTQLPRVLDSYTGEITRLGAPFGLLLLQLGALVLFFMVVISALVRRSERRELTMLKSRGVDHQQLLILRGVETLLICLAMTIIAPPVARQLLVWLIPLFTAVDALPLAITAGAYASAGAAALVSLVILVATLVPVLNAPLVMAQGHSARQQGAVWWQRYYLDVVMLVIAVAAMLQILAQRSLFAAEGDNGETLTDPLLLLAPTLLVFALGSVSLRFFPAVIALAQRILRGLPRLEPVLASWQVSREPLHYGRITFLLALAISIGWFALVFQQTITRSLVDQAVYRVGADLRVTLAVSSEVPDADTLNNLDGVEGAVPALRLTGQDLSTRSGSFNIGDVLAVDSPVFAEVARWREDLGPLVTGEWTGEAPPSGYELPLIPQAISLWARYRIQSLAFQQEMDVPVVAPDLLVERAAFSARIRDGDGTLHIVELGAAETDEPGGWVRYTADAGGLAGLPEPLVFEGVDIRLRDESEGFQTRIITELRLRDLTLTTTDGDESVLPPFAEDAWLINDLSGIASDSAFAQGMGDDPTVDPQREERSLTVNFFQDDAVARVRLLFNEAGSGEQASLPALVSAGYTEAENLTVGQRFSLFLTQTQLWLEVAGIVEYYPTLYDETSSFIVLDLVPLLQVLSQRGSGNLAANEVWFALADPDAADRVIAQIGGLDDDLSISEAASAAGVQRELEADLLSLGLSGLLFLSSLVGFVLGSVSLLTYTSLSIQARGTELAVLRALGFSTSRVMLTLAIEQAFVVGVALVLGLGIGLLLSTQVLPVLSNSTAGPDLTPPFLVQIDPGLLVAYAGGILLVLAGQLAIGALLVRRLTTTQALRVVGE